MLIIRFVRRGRKKQAFFDLVAAEKSKAVQKKFIEKLGYLDPLAKGGEGELVFNEESIKKHIKNGAQMSQAAARILTKNGLKEAGKFIETRVTKPKKEKKAEEKKEEVATEEPTEGTTETSTDTPEKTPKEEPASADSEPPKEEVKTEAPTPEKSAETPTEDK